MNIFDVGPKLYKCYTNVLCLLGRAGWRLAQRRRCVNATTQACQLLTEPLEHTVYHKYTYTPTSQCLPPADVTSEGNKDCLNTGWQTIGKSTILITAGWNLLHAGRYKIHLVGQPALPVLWGTLIRGLCHRLPLLLIKWNLLWAATCLEMPLFLYRKGGCS